jgi:hypothetical protein
MNMASVAGRFEVSRRRGGLSFSHHAEVAGLPAEEQELWLDRAEVARLSVRSLRSELRRARRRGTRAALGLRATDGGEPAASGVNLQVECPECGHHFNPAADREVSDPDHAGSGTRARPQLASAHRA